MRALGGPGGQTPHPWPGAFSLLSASSSLHSFPPALSLFQLRTPLPRPLVTWVYLMSASSAGLSSPFTPEVAGKAVRFTLAQSSILGE